MFGYLRFFLAYLVLLSHIYIKFYGLNVGVFAVVIFYILAGFVVSHLYLNILPKTKDRIYLFYKDRFLRIFPLYIYVVIITLLFLFVTSYGNPKYNIQNLVSNFTIIPLNYYMYLDSTVLQKPSWCLIPPAWSLGAELQAYILLSIVLVLKKTKYILAILTMVVYVLANFSVFHPDYFGYRFLLGVFFIFLIGSCLQKIKSNKTEDNFDKYFPLFVWIVILILTPIFYITNSFSPTWTKETFIGLLIGIPLIYFLTKIKIKLPFDTFFGSLSYGIFLTHFLAIWILDYLNFTKKDDFYLVSLTFLSILIALVGIYLIENNITNYRKNNSKQQNSR
jgi:peptidoglycan/LPS O-acetylase OafA/YrhL